MRQRTSQLSLTYAALILLLATTAWVSACGGKQSQNDLFSSLPELSEDSEIDVRGPYLYVADGGRIVVQQRDRTIEKASYFRIIPKNWDESLSTEPTLGTGILLHQNNQTLALIVAQTPNTPIHGARIQPTGGLTPITGHKALVRIAGINHSDNQENDTAPTQVTFHIGTETGIAEGDWFFVLNEQALDKKQPRVGHHIGALLRVSDVSENQAIADVIHAIQPVTDEQYAVFAQHTAPAPASPIHILVAPFSKDATDPESTLAPILKALPTLAQTYGISNTSIDTLDEPIDPRPWDASYAAEDAAPDTGWGVAVFGDIEDQSLIFNAVGYGNVPSPSGWVGILPGGLVLPFKDDVSELADQLALSYLSNGLGMRGNHAQAVYMLETELQRDDIEPRMRYHLHEHLALRYAALGRLDEAMRIMHYDLFNAKKEDDTYAQLNAYSIRSYLDREAGLPEQNIRDERAFLELAEGNLPDYALDGERLGLARALLENDEIDEAEKLISSVANRAKERGDYRIHMHAITLLTRVQIIRDQLEAALLVFDALEDDIESYPKETRVSLRMLRAELLAKMGDFHDSLDTLFETFDELEEISLSGQATALQRSAGIMMAISQPLQATRAILDAAKIYNQLHLVPETAGMLALAAHLRLGLAEQLPPQQANEMLVDALQEFQRAATLYRALGNNADAAEATFYVAVLNGRFHSTGAKDPLYDVTKKLYLELGDFESLAQVTLFQQHIATAMGDTASAKAFAEEAQKWLDIGDIDLESVEDPEQEPTQPQELPLTNDDET